MSSEKRLVYFLFVSFLAVFSIQYLMIRTGIIKPQEPEQAAVAQEDPAAEKAKADAEAKKLAKGPREPGDLPDDVFTPDSPAKPAVAEVAKASEAPKGPVVKRVDPSELVLGTDDDESPDAYHLRLQLDQTGATVYQATTAKYDAEIDPTAPRPAPGARRPRLKLIDQDRESKAPGSLGLTLISAAKANKPINGDADEVTTEAPRIEAPLDRKTWDVVRDKDDAPAVKRITRTDPVTRKPVEGQEIAFRITSVEPAATIIKTYRLWKGADDFEVELKFASPITDSKFVYRLFGTHGIPVEGAWYTSSFRDVFFGQSKEGVTLLSKPLASTDIVKAQADPTANHYSTLPLKFAGVEDQYFTTFLQPWPIPKTDTDRVDSDTGPFVFAENVKEPQFSDVGVEMLSKPIVLGRNLGEVVHNYKVYVGPKLASQLAPYEAEDLASYRKQWIPIPYASELARYVISPLLDKIYALTQSVGHLFGWKNGNYGIAIILLTMTVRMIMFPIGRKQAMMAKKMQDLQPYIAEVKEKYKDDKEAMTRETMALWKRHKVNPAAGCLPALIQMPIFVALWQCLNNSVALRHSKFLYISDLAAPDMLFHLPFTIPFINADYFNLLPFLVVSLMLVQTKLFSPPPTTPEAEMNQKMMKYMMVLMAFMFYKVPSGLGLYFITSSLWQVCERLLLPKVLPAAKPVDEPDDSGPDRGRGPGGPNGNGNGNGSGGGSGVQGWLGKKLEKLLEDAAKDKTIRNLPSPGRESERPGNGRERERERDRNRPNPRPGKRR